MGIGNTNIGQGERRDRLIKERIHDPYKPRGQLAEPSRCGDCGVVYTQGRWQWLAEPPGEASEVLCPACRRVRDRVPAGYLTLAGPFFTEHREEILALVRNTVDAQKGQHPMKRLMDIEDNPEGETVVTFTDIHLPRGVGDAIASAYEGCLEVQYTPEAGLLRAYWRR